MSITLEDLERMPVELKTDEMAYRVIRHFMLRYPVQVGSKEKAVADDMPIPADAYKRGNRWYVAREARNYHSPDGFFRCPVGWLIPRKLYETKAPPQWQIPGDRKRRTWGELIEGDSVESPVVRACLGIAGWHIRDKDLLWQLQQIHDNLLPQYWADQLLFVGVSRGWCGP